jgi:hypothetical protein
MTIIESVCPHRFRPELNWHATLWEWNRRGRKFNWRFLTKELTDLSLSHDHRSHSFVRVER